MSATQSSLLFSQKHATCLQAGLGPPVILCPLYLKPLHQSISRPRVHKGPSPCCMQPWASWQDKHRLWEALTFLRLVRPGPLSVYPSRLSSRALIMGGEWVSRHRRKMGWDLRLKMSQDHPSLPPSQSPCCRGPHGSAEPSTPPPQTSPSAWMPATPPPTPSN